MNTSQHIANTPNPSSIAQVLHAANMAAIEKASTSEAALKNDPPADTVLVRIDVQGRPTLFFPLTYDKERHVISYWSADKNSNVHETSADYYFTSKPADDDTIKMMAEKYSNRFKVKQLTIRKRLLKSNMMDRDDEGKATTVDVQDFKARLLAAITKAIQETL